MKSKDELTGFKLTLFSVHNSLNSGARVPCNCEKAVKIRKCSIQRRTHTSFNLQYKSEQNIKIFLNLAP